MSVPHIVIGLLFLVLGYLLWRIRPRYPDALEIAEAEHREWVKRRNPVTEAKYILSKFVVTNVDAESFDRVAAERPDAAMYPWELEELWDDCGSVVDVLQHLAQRGDFIIASDKGRTRAYLPGEWPPEESHGQD